MQDGEGEAWVFDRPLTVDEVNRLSTLRGEERDAYARELGGRKKRLVDSGKTQSVEADFSPKWDSRGQEVNRRNFLASLVAAPWVVHSGVLMPVRRIVTQPLSGAYEGIAVRLWSASLFTEVVRQSLFDGTQWDRVELAALRSRKAPALAFNRIRIGR